MEIMRKKYPTTLGSIFNTAFDEFDTFFKPTVYFNDWAPFKYEKFDETDKEVKIELDMPGFEKEEINVELKEQEQSGYHRVLVSAKSSNREFNRTIWTPTNFDFNKIVANYKNGVLTITAPRTKRANNIKTVEVSSN